MEGGVKCKVKIIHVEVTEMERSSGSDSKSMKERVGGDRTMEGRVKYIGKVGVVLKCPYASKELTWRGIVR